MSFLKSRLNKSSIIQLLKFAIVGISNSAVSLLVYYIFIFINARLYIVGNTLGYFLSVINSFIWNGRLVFRGKTESARRSFIKIFISYLFTFLIQTALLFIMVEVLYISDVTAPLLNIFIILPINFILNKFWVFKDRDGGGG